MIYALTKKLLGILVTSFFSACAFMKYWSGLYSVDTQKMIKEGVDLMLKTANKLVGRKGRASNVLLLKDKEAASEDEGDGSGGGF
jgi:hypothetical protein